MSILELNEQLYAKKPKIGSADFCICDHCRFYADNIVKNKGLIAFLQSFGIDALKADEVSCYMEDAKYKYYSVDLNYIFSNKEGTFPLSNAKVTISRHSHLIAPNNPPYWMDMQVRIEI
ncbi:MAG: hypothetical protein ABS944_05955 [Solibacillus sp.]|uniref:hypothetical protein n=1 Tax=Solibacillus sp. TaxID=1909654 RepID=UPI00331574D3